MNQRERDLHEAAIEWAEYKLEPGPGSGLWEDLCDAAIAYANTPRSTKTDPPQIGQEVLVWLGGADLWTGGKWDHALSSDRYPYWLPMPPKPEETK